MTHQSAEDDATTTTTLPQVEIPTIRQATPAELERRKIIVQRILRRHERVGPIGITADDLLHEAEMQEYSRWTFSSRTVG